MKKTFYYPLIMTSAFLLGCQGSTSSMSSSSSLTTRTYTVQPTVSNATKSDLLEAKEVFQLSPSMGDSTYHATLTLNLEDTDQEIEGFGAAMTESSALMIQSLPLSAQEEVMNNLFSSDGISLSYVRLAMGASDFATSNYSYSDIVDETGTDMTLANFSIARDKEAIIPQMKIAKTLNPQLSIMGSPWSAPAWMKTNGSMNGGQIKTEYLDVYADYFVKFVQAYAEEGLTIDSVTLQNEPLYQTSGYPTMEMPSNVQIAFTKKVGQRFAAESIATDIIIFDHNWDLANYAHTVMANDDVQTYSAGAAYHCYGGDYTQQQTFRNLFPDKGLWFTECSGGGWASDFGANLLWQTKNLFIGSMTYGTKAVMLWNLVLDENGGPKNGGCQNCRGVVTISTTGDVTYNEEYYALGQFSKFVMPGAVRFETELDDTFGDTISSIGFRNPNGDLVLVILNEGYSRDLRINLNGSVGVFKATTRSVSTLVIKG